MFFYIKVNSSILSLLIFRSYQKQKTREIEIKFKLDDPDKIKQKIKKMGTIKESSFFEDNIIFDDEN